MRKAVVLGGEKDKLYDKRRMKDLHVKYYPLGKKHTAASRGTHSRCQFPPKTCNVERTEINL